MKENPRPEVLTLVGREGLEPRTPVKNQKERTR